MVTVNVNQILCVGVTYHLLFDIIKSKMPSRIKFLTHSSVGLASKSGVKEAH